MYQSYLNAFGFTLSSQIGLHYFQLIFSDCILDSNTILFIGMIRQFHITLCMFVIIQLQIILLISIVGNVTSKMTQLFF